MLERSDCADRLRKIRELKNVKGKRDEFLKTDFGYPSFLNLFKTIQEMSNELKNYGIEISSLITTPDGFDDDKYRKTFIYIESEGGNFGIEYIEKLFQVYDSNDGDYYDPEPEYIKSPGIDVFYNYNNMKNEPIEKQTFYIQVDDSCTVLWGHFSPIEFAKDIAERIVRNLE